MDGKWMTENLRIACFIHETMVFSLGIIRKLTSSVEYFFQIAGFGQILSRIPIKVLRVAMNANIIFYSLFSTNFF
jgi:hypothetical protein